MAENEAQQGAWTLPDGWAWTTLERCVDILDRQRIPVNAKERGARIAGKPPSELYPYYGATGQVGWIDGYLFNAELVLLGEDGAPFLQALKDKAYIIRGKSWVNNHAHVLRAIAGLMLNSYLCHYLNVADYRDYVTGTTRLKLNQSRMRKIPIPLAPFPEQRRIVAEIETQFTRLDAAVVALERARANLRRYKAAVLKAACEGRLVPTEAELTCAEGRDYEAADQLLAHILAERRARWETEQWGKEVEKARQKVAKVARKAAGHPLKRGEKLAPEEWQDLPEDVYGQYLPRDDRWKQKYKEPSPPDTEGLPELPEGWVWVTVEQIGDVRLGRQRSPRHHQGPFMRPYLRAANATWNGVDLSDVKEMNFPPESFESYRLQKDDILLAEASGSRSEVGKPFVWNEQIPDCCFQNTLIRVRLWSLPPSFVHLHFLQDALTGRFGKVAKGIGIHHLGANRLSVLPIALPPLLEQRRIVAEVERRLSLMAALEASVEAALARAGRLRQAVLKQAFEGRLVPQDPGDEPASVLLERLRERREVERKGEEASRKKRQPRQLELL